VKVKYDGLGDTLSILLSEAQIVDAEEHRNVIVNYDKNGRLVEIEILNASRFLGDFVSTLVRAKVGEKQLEVPA